MPRIDQTPRSRAIAVVLLLGLATPISSIAQPADEDMDKVFVGYLYGRPEGLDLGLYTHLCHAFVTADEQGRIRPSRGVPNADLARRAHEAGVRMLVSLGGWGWDEEFAAIVADPEAEDRYVEAVLKLVDESDYDGIDLDWEYPDTEQEVEGFERLVRRFRAGLDAIEEAKWRPMVLTMAASSNPGTLRWLRTGFLLETMDWVNVMTYDFAGDWTDYAGHHSPLFASSKVPGSRRPSTEATMRYLVEERGMPADRLAVGIPLYGRGFAVAEPYAPAKDAPKARIPQGNYANLHRLLDEEGWTRLWDDETKNPWLVAPDRSAVIGYDDAESVAIKTEWAMEQGFRGVFFWQVAADRLPDGSHPLQEAAHKAWEESALPAR
ncbi:glycoside hydrolase family 18 protein [Tautonia plasticadhaerens]|uniref:chitinase n=1 Tax=Tautonia plasticadhaerens TaxID=2527974 RepID=A0A518H459_9BACT|nr:glycoside hydrolase family 18 protein [Tautonia plasticadhaerens]QDV35607.1 Chitinase A1 precursor [Tautonia plasticadhaerens]